MPIGSGKTALCVENRVKKEPSISWGEELTILQYPWSVGPPLGLLWRGIILWSKRRCSPLGGEFTSMAKRLGDLGGESICGQAASNREFLPDTNKGCSFSRHHVQVQSLAPRETASLDGAGFMTPLPCRGTRRAYHTMVRCGRLAGHTTRAFRCHVIPRHRTDGTLPDQQRALPATNVELQTYRHTSGQIFRPEISPHSLKLC